MTGSPIGSPLVGHENQVTAAAFDPDGTHLVTGSSDGTIRLWNLAADLPVTIEHPVVVAGSPIEP